jgi:23S rRNA A1618 N6-methylase RlmF
LEFIRLPSDCDDLSRLVRLVVVDAHSAYPYQANLSNSLGRINAMDLVASEALTEDTKTANQRTEQIALEKSQKAELKRLQEEAARRQVDLIHELASQNNDYAFIERYLIDNNLGVNSVIRQEIWLAINREPLSNLLREHHSAVRLPIFSNPVTYQNHGLDLTPEELVVMRQEMSRRLQEVEQYAVRQSNVKWGGKLRKHAKWEYLKDEVVPLHAWLKQQHAVGRGMNMVRSEMGRRYGQLFDFR